MKPSLGDQVLIFLATLCLASCRLSEADDGNLHEPSIIQSPQSKKAPNGGIVSFFCKASGNPAPDIKWQKNGNDLGTSKQRYLVFDMPFGSVLRIEPVRQRRDDAMFTCTATNGVGEAASAQAQLTVYPNDMEMPRTAPKIVVQPNLKSVEKDRPASMQCATEGTPPPRIYWLKDYIPVDISDPRITVSESGTLNIMNSRKSDQGKYECVAENEAGVAYSYAANLYVRVRNVAPRFSIQPPEMLDVMPGGDINITCVAVGSPMPVVRWKLGVTDLAPVADAPLGKNVLILKDVQQSANYTCFAASDLGNIEAITQVKVKALPNPPVHLEISEVTATSVKLSWDEGNNDPIDSYIINYKPKYKQGVESKSISGIVETEHTITGLVSYTIYEFRVVAVNNIGRGRPSEPKECTTGEQQPSTPPRNVRARPLSTSTLYVQWDEPEIPNGLILGYQVYYTLKEEGENLAERPYYTWQNMAVTDKVANIRNLSPNRTYVVCVLGRTSVGDGPPSEYVEVLTRQGVPEQPRNLQTEVRGPDQIYVTWEKPENSDDIITSYELYYQSPSRGKVRVTIQPPVESYLLEDLIPATVYNIHVLAKSERGTGPESPVVQATTQEFTPSAPPQDVTGEIEGATAIIIKWSPPPLNARNGQITEYKIRYVETESGQQLQEASVVTVLGEKDSVVIRNLKIWTKYTIWVQAATRVGPGPNSVPIVVRTDEAVPGRPERVRVETVNSTAIRVRWSSPAPDKRNGIIRAYVVIYGKIDISSMQLIGSRKRHTISGGQVTETVITGLQPDSSYKFQVAAVTGKGDGIYSKGKIAKTLGAVPERPRSFRVNLINEDPPMVQLVWQRPRNIYGALQAYKLEYGKVGSDKFETIALEAEQYQRTVTSLDRGAEYEFRLSARNTVDYGEKAVQNIKTPDSVPYGYPMNFTMSAKTSTVAQLSWKPPPADQCNGRIIMYEIEYYKKLDDINSFSLNVSQMETEVSGLETNEVYLFQIKAYTSKGPGPWSPKYQFKTYKQLPAAPTNIKLRRTSHSTIQVTWNAPNFPIKGYRIFYSSFPNRDMDLWTKKTIPPVTATDLIQLTDSCYYVRVQAQSLDGRFGNLSDQEENCEQPPEIPQCVRSFTAVDTSSDYVVLDWDPPLTPGVVKYKILYEGSQRDILVHPRSEITVRNQERVKISELFPETRYTFNISAQFLDGSLGPYVYTLAETQRGVLERPQFRKMNEDKTIGFQLKSRSRIGKVDYYWVVVVPKSHFDIKEPNEFEENELQSDISPAYIAAQFEGNNLPDMFSLSDGNMYGNYRNKRLDENEEYKVFLRAVTTENEVTSSDYSEPFSLKRGVPPRRSPLTPAGGGFIWIVGVVAAVILLIIFIVIVFFVVRRKSKRKEKAPEPTKVFVDPTPPGPQHPTDPVEMRRMNFQTPAMISHPPIPVEQLAEHIDRLKAQDNLKFSQEYESIEPGQQFTWDNSNLEVNKPKNRYANVIAYDHSRVILQPLDAITGSDYINANYMDGYRKQNAYIATQGPLPETFCDFWRMVWEQRSATIVMMTKLEERSRIKCDQYWPLRGTENYGVMQVTILDIMDLATYTIRTFQLSRQGYPEKREVKQFQFTAWPDHGVPDHPTPLLMFMRRVKASTPPDSGPMITHCSAGVGRTGAFIVIDAMLERIRHERTVDIYGHVTCLRAQRNYMVQTEDQYIFIHDALLEAVTCGNTEIPARNLYAHLQKLTQPEPGETVTGMELEFKRLAHTKANPSRFVSANLPVNKFKNRLVNILPYENTRVCLQPIRGVDGSDYINASYIDGYRYRGAYIATQGPLGETTEDFWRMLWEHNSTIIVMLTKLREMGREKCHQYWPSERSARYQYFVVDPMAEYNMPQYILREFKVTDARDGQSRTIRQFQFTDWPEQGVPKSGEGFIDFIGQVHKTKEQFGQDGPISVHCSAGVGRTGVFIALSIVLERMRYEGVVDLFQTVRMLRTQRPAMVQTEDQYQFCYRAALEYLGSFDHYAN
ncbi:tyrosine-protein phosphatase Lar isoform X2 [Lingula anatina]|uniref:protein-tyrosine-phosphatase n=1 Tax=Lingula anatina TaxID=7574 RepID=A0A1S3HRJ8_LINAN|nr:tyrosine-protein phosphatase Lar isoform X2 [Lingula anatina]|eukprot:XP_013388176.1 tyrosine-protein phosphatase Lar isoform X2 [Lingula anatina]